MNIMQTVSNVRNTIRRHKMLEKGDSVLICVSGGPDSVFLTYTLNYLKKEFNLKLFIAHLEHGIRGKESFQDMRFVEKMSRDMGIRAITKRVKIKKSKTRSMEEIAREERYGFFKEAAKKFKVKKIATAHNLDDQAETIMMRVIRGVSVKGLGGIPPVRKEEGYVFIRPLIELEKMEILNFLNEKRIKYRVDKTNSDEKIFRNAVRKSILPFLSKYNPKIKRSLSNLADNVRESAIQRSGKDAVKDALEKAGCNIKKLTHRHWKEIKFLIESAPRGKSLDLPGKIRIVKK